MRQVARDRGVEALRYKGTRGDDNLLGTSADDVFRIRFGGRDFVDGGGGFDRLTVDFSKFASGYSAADTIYLDKTGLSGLFAGLYDEHDTDYSYVGFKNIDRISYTGTSTDNSLQIFIQADYDRRTIFADLGLGSDTLYYRGDGLADVSQMVDCSIEGVVHTNIGTISGVDKLIVFVGNADDIVNGSKGDDELYLNGGSDSATGGDGNDIIYGSFGDDILVGGGGDDKLFGGGDIDSLTGGAGADRFIFLSSQESTIDALDSILDFSHEEFDRIDLRNVDADRTIRGEQTFVFIDQNPFTGPGGQHGELRQQINGDGTITLEGDRNHDGVADFAILIHVTAPLVAADLIL